LLDLEEIIADDERDLFSFKFSGDALVTIRDNRSGLCVKRMRMSLKRITHGITNKHDIKISDENK